MSRLFEYDPLKSERNRECHGIDFEQAQALWKVPHLFYPTRPVYGEERIVILGKLTGHVYIAIFTLRGSAIRLISCHRADKRWVREYERGRYEK
jgi:uncharacterized DUF497 family protein